MPLKPIEKFPAGGVDSRSNPISMPADRWLQVQDLWPQQDGGFRLRDGYTLLASGLQTGVPIHSVISVNGSSSTVGYLPLPTLTNIINWPSAWNQTPGTFYVTLVMIDNNGLIYKSAEVGPLVFDGSHTIHFNWSSLPPNAATYYVYWGTAPGAENQFFTIPAASMGLNSTFGGPGFGTPGSIPPGQIIAGQFKPFIVFWQGTTPYICDPATGIVTTPLVRGNAVASSARFSYFYANGHLHAFNGTDAKWFDGVQWRDIGLPTLTAAQAAAIAITPGLQAITPSQASAVGVAAASGGSWLNFSGISVSLAFFDLATNILAASPLTLGSAPVNLTTGQKINLTSLPVSPISTVVALLALQGPSNFTPQGGAPFAYTSIFNMTGPATISGNVVTLPITAHGLSTGAVLAFDISGGTNIPLDGPFAITVVDANHVSFTSQFAASYAGIFATGFVLLVVPHGTTSASINSGNYCSNQGLSFNNAGQNIFPFANDTTQITGLPASSIGGAQPGYQLFASIYNLVTGHVGNRISLGFRINNAATIASLLFTGCPVFSDTEWVLLLGRTSDGAEIPYAIIDNNANWRYVPHGQTNFTLIPFGIDGNSELPERNFPPPATLDYNYQLSLLPGGSAQNPGVTATFARVWVESDHCCGVIDGQATIYRSGSAQDFREGQFVGLPEQSWDPADIETFPTGQPITSGHGYQQESWTYTSEDSGILMELAGETQWQGPFNEGACGQHAWTRGWKNMPFWISGRKQLCTISQGGYEQMAGMMQTTSGGPIPISDEYEAALLAKIGDTYLPQTEIVYIRIPSKRVDVLRIKALDSNGNPFTIIHDFNIRDDRSPYGQAYQENFMGPLQSNFTLAAVRDGNSIAQIVAGGSDGNLYLLYSGGADQGLAFVGQALGLVYIGPQRTAVKFIEWYGDSTLQIFISKSLAIPFDPIQMNALCADAPTEVQGEEGNNHWIVDVEVPEMIHAYVLLKLASHQQDGNTNLNTPPHIPVENYGRVWLVAPQLGASRPK